MFSLVFGFWNVLHFLLKYCFHSRRVSWDLLFYNSHFTCSRNWFFWIWLSYLLVFVSLFWIIITAEFRWNWLSPLLPKLYDQYVIATCIFALTCQNKFMLFFKIICYKRCKSYSNFSGVHFLSAKFCLVYNHVSLNNSISFCNNNNNWLLITLWLLVYWIINVLLSSLLSSPLFQGRLQLLRVQSLIVDRLVVRPLIRRGLRLTRPQHLKTLDL